MSLLKSKRNKVMKNLICIFVLSLVWYPMFAQINYIDKKNLGDAKVNCPTEVELYKSFTYSISIPEKRDSIATPLPQLKEFDDVVGPSISSTHNLSLINGKMTETDTTKYVWMLVTRAEKEYIIPSLSIVNKSNTAYYVAPEVKVNSKKYIPRQISNHRDQIATTQNTSLVKDSILVKWDISTEKANVGDTIRCTCWLYSLKDVTQFKSLGISQIDNCFIEECELPETKSFEITTIDSVNWRRVKCAEYIITPYSPGKLTLGGDKYIATIMQADSSIDPFEAFFNGVSAYKEVEVELVSQKKWITISDDKKKDNQVVIENKGNGIYVLMDISGSTKMQDFSPNRLSAENTFARGVVNAIPNVGLLSFDAEPEFFVPYGSANTTSEIVNYIDTVANPVNDGTSVSNALLYTLLKTRDAKSLIVLCDGLDNTAHVSLNSTLDILEKSGVQVNMVYFNSYNDSCYYEMRGADSLTIVRMKNDIVDREILKKIAKKIKKTGGNIFYIKKGEDINAILPTIIKVAQTPAPRKNTSQCSVPKELMEKLRTMICH